MIIILKLMILATQIIQFIIVSVNLIKNTIKWEIRKNKSNISKSLTTKSLKYIVEFTSLKIKIKYFILFYF